MTTTATPPTTSPAARPSLAEQRERHRRSRRRALRAFFALLLVALVGTAVWLVYFSSVLDTRTVVVSGTRELTRDQVSQAAAVPLGQAPGPPAARRGGPTRDLPAAGVRRRVTREWPHTVHVAVTERVPLLAVAQPGGFLVVDRAGVVFAARTTRPAGVVEVAADPADRPLLVELGSVVLALPDDVRDQVVSISAATRDSITLKTTSGVTIVWGDASQTPLKAQVAVALLASGAKTSIDVSAPHAPAVR